MKQLLLKPAFLIKYCQLSKSLFFGSLHIIQCGPSFDLCFLALLSVNIVRSFCAHLLYDRGADVQSEYELHFSQLRPMSLAGSS